MSIVACYFTLFFIFINDAPFLVIQVRTMAYAYALSPGKEKASALSNVRSGYRECTETLCSLEVQIEQLIGTLTLEMKGMIAFSFLEI